VFVGRVEVLSPWTQQTIRDAMSAGDVPTLSKFGRFLEPFLQQIRRTRPDAAESLGTNAFLVKARQEIQNSSSSTRGGNSGSCVE
jgi:hypothetical protein